jgi:hypothetical protein
VGGEDLFRYLPSWDVSTALQLLLLNTLTVATLCLPDLLLFYEQPNRDNPQHLVTKLFSTTKSKFSVILEIVKLCLKPGSQSLLPFIMVGG